MTITESSVPSKALFDLEEVDRLLTTTRAVRRRLDFDRPVEPEVLERCIGLAVQAPSANNRQNWRWVIVTDRKLVHEIAELYRIAWQLHGAAASQSSRRRRDAGGVGRQGRSLAAGQWLLDNLERIPALVFPCVVGRPPKEHEGAAIEAAWRRGFDPSNGEAPTLTLGAGSAPASPIWDSMYYGSIYPAVWSFQLALRSRGLGTVITVAHLVFEREIAQILNLPSMVTQICMMPVAHTIGTTFRPGPRLAAGRRTYWNSWDTPRSGENVGDGT